MSSLPLTRVAEHAVQKWIHESSIFRAQRKMLLLSVGLGGWIVACTASASLTLERAFRNPLLESVRPTRGRIRREKRRKGRGTRNVWQTSPYSKMETQSRARRLRVSSRNQYSNRYRWNRHAKRRLLVIASFRAGGWRWGVEKGSELNHGNGGNCYRKELSDQTAR